ncbi:MAG: PTS sugar transporter subunit IIA [Candidatus Omnitrophota bacterium]|nr:MAG: PTS sugar transporter subunit IIA [Candidatus Omnitrophota bacterium]
MKITDFLSEKDIIIGLKNVEKEKVLEELLTLLEKNKKIKNKGEILKALLEREKLGSTGIGQGIAVPHVKTNEVNTLVGALGISHKGVEFNSLDGEPVYIIFLLLAPTKATGIHLKALAKIARLLKDRVFRNSLRNAKTASEAFRIIKEDEERLNKLT